MKIRTLFTLVFLLLVVAAVAGCGSGDDDDQSGSSDEPSAAADGSKGFDSGSDLGGGGSGGGSTEEGPSVEEVKLPKELSERFKQLGGDVSGEDRAQILAVFASWREAMAAEDWEAACRYLQTSLRENTEPPKTPEDLPEGIADKIEIPEDFPGTCTERLERAAENPGPEKLGSKLRVGAVRSSSDDLALIVYTAGGKADWYLMGMVREEGEWKAAAARALPVG